MAPLEKDHKIENLSNAQTNNQERLSSSDFVWAALPEHLTHNYLSPNNNYL